MAEMPKFSMTRPVDHIVRRRLRDASRDGWECDSLFAGKGKIQITGPKSHGMLIGVQLNKGKQKIQTKCM